MLPYLTRKIAKARPPERWRDILVNTPEAKLTKEDIYRYYMHPKVRKNLVKSLGSNPVTVIHKYRSHQPVLKRHSPDSGELIRITKDKKNPDDPKDFLYWVTRRTVEFHPTFGRDTDSYYVDLDPGKRFDFEDTKTVAKAVGAVLSDRPEVKKVEYIYTGGDGVYVKANLRESMPTDVARMNLKDILGPLEGGPVTFGIKPDQKSLRIDLGTLKQMGSLRAPYSINSETGLVAIPIKNLRGFSKEDAKIEKVLGGPPPPAKVYRP